MEKKKNKDPEMVLFGMTGMGYLPGIQAAVTKAKDSRQMFEYQFIPPYPFSKGTLDYRGYVPWGPNNDIPQQVKQKVAVSEVLSGGLRFNIDAGYGEGIVYGRIKINDDGTRQFVQANDVDEINAFMENNDINLYLLKQLTDMNYFYNTFPEIILDQNDPDKRKVVVLRSKEACFSRWESMNPKTGYIEHHFYSGKFGIVYPNEDDVDVTEVLAPDNIAQDLLQRIGRLAYPNGKKHDDRVFRYIIPNGMPTPGIFYYNAPSWYSLFQSGWYDYAVLIPTFKNALMNNQMTIKYHVELSDRYFPDIFKEEGITSDTAKKARIKLEYTNLNTFLTSPQNTGKSVISYITYAVDGKELRKMKITVLEDKMKGGEYNEDSEEASNMMNYALGVHPSLVGAAPGKTKTINGTEARELFIIKQALLKPLRDRILKPLYIIKQVNNWPKEIVFTIPNIQLVTMDINKVGNQTVSETPQGGNVETGN